MNDIFYALLNKFEVIVKSLADFAITAKSNVEIDNTPNKLNLPGEVGDIITKDRHLIYYKSVNSNRFLSLSSQFPQLIIEYKSVLSSGINRVATWTKGVNGWKFNGYVTQNMDENCCLIDTHNIPFISWNPLVSSIVYGTPLTDDQLNAVATYNGQYVEGTYKYSPDFGTILHGGSHTLNVVFTPEDTFTYTTASKSVIIEVTKVRYGAEYHLIWDDFSSSIVYGNPLNEEYLNARAEYNSGSIDGKYVYNPGYGAILGVGTNIPLHCTFYPNASRDFEVLSASQDVDVVKANITDFASWGTPIYGLCGGKYTEDILSATVGAVETNYNIQYKDDQNNSIYIGKLYSNYNKNETHRLTASISPTNEDNYEGGEIYSTFIIKPLNVNIEWNISVNTVEYGSVFSTAKYFTNVNAKDDDGNDITSLGTFSYSYSSDGITYTSIIPDTTTCNITTGNVFLKCIFSLTDTTQCYQNTTTNIKTLQVVKNTSYTIDWAATSTITYGDSLSSILNATRTPNTIAGSFSYTWQGETINNSTVIPVGQHQLIATFNPTDTDNYAIKTATKLLTVNQSTNYNIYWGVPVSINYGTDLSNILTASADQVGNITYKEGTTEVFDSTILPVGTHTLTATCTPANTNYGKKSTSRTFSVVQASNYTIEWNLSDVNGNVIHSFTSFDKRAVNLSEWNNLVAIKYNNTTNLLKGTKNYYENSISPSNKLNDGDLLSVGTHSIVCEFVPDDSNYDTKSITRTIVISDYVFDIVYISDHLFNINIKGYRNDISSNTTAILNDSYSILYDSTHYDTYNVTSIERNAFNDSNNTSLQYVTGFIINESSETITSIGDTAFSGLINLTSIVNGTNSSNDVFEYVTLMGSNPFRGCANLTPVKINNNNFTTIDNLLYQKESNSTLKLKCYYESLTNNSYILPENLSSIDTYAFSNNNTFNKNKLQVLIINNDVNDITFNTTCFYKCKNIKTIYFTGDKYIRVNSPFNTDNLVNFTYEDYGTIFYYNDPAIFTYANGYIVNAIKVGAYTSNVPAPASKNGSVYTINTKVKFSDYTIKDNVNDVTTFHIPYGYTTITGSGLGNCMNLTTINIPASVTGIDESNGIGYGASNLQYINVYPYDNDALNSCKYKVYNNRTTSYRESFNTPKISNVLFEKKAGSPDLYTLICYPMGKTNPSYTLFEPALIFYIDKIGNYAFYNNKNLKHLIWNYDSNTILKYIGNYAFHMTECDFDNDVNQYIPVNVEYIGKRAFYNNTKGIRYVRINENLRNYGGEVCNAFTMFNNFNNTANPYAAIGEVVEISASTVPMPISIEVGGETVTGYTGIQTDFSDQAVYLYENETLNDIYDDPTNIKNLLSLYMINEDDRIDYTLPETVEIVSDYAAYGNHSLKSLNMGVRPHLNYVGNYGFANCRNLESISIPYSLKRVNDNGFASNPLLSSINFGNCDIQVIGQRAFEKNYSLKAIELKFDTTSNISISHLIFNNCTDLRVITLSGTYPLIVNNDDYNITSDAFANVNSTLGSFYIYYPKSWESESTWATMKSRLKADSNAVLVAYETSNHINYIDHGTYIEVCGVDNDPATISVPSSINSKDVTTISDYAFVNKSLTTLSLPSTLTSIGKYIVSGCKNLATISIGSNDNFAVSNNVVLYKTDGSKKILYVYAPNASATYYTSSTMTDIRESAFDSCQNLDSIYISSTVTNIEEHAFCQCKELSKIYVDSANSDFIATNGTIEGNNNSSDDGILFKINKINGNVSDLTLLYVPQNINAHFIRIPSGFTINTSNLYVTTIASYAIENTSLNIIILPSRMSLYNDNAIVYNNSLNSIIFTSNTIPTTRNFLKNIVKQDNRNTEIYTTLSYASVGYNINYLTTITDFNGTGNNYYIYNNVLIACTVDNANSDSNINIYNNFYNSDTGTKIFYNEIDNFALANRAGTMNNYSITFLNDPNNVTGNENITSLNSNMFYGSSMVNQLIFVNTPAPSYGSGNMFNLSGDTFIPNISVTGDYVSGWTEFVNGYYPTGIIVRAIGSI